VVNHAADGRRRRPHVGRMMLIGPRLNFTNSKDAEMSDEGFMFYTTDPTRSGYTLDAKGHTIFKKGRS